MPVRYQIGGATAAQVCDSVEAGVRSGALPTGSALPTVRALAAELSLAPATVAAAYRTLRQRGVVETAGRNGTRIRPRPPLAPRLLRVTPEPAGIVDLSRGEPDPALLPDLGPLLAAVDPSAVSYGDGGPLPQLVTAARARLEADGVPTGEAAITVASGALDSIERLLTSHLRPGDRVAVEDPGWANLIDLVAALGLEAVPLPVDDAGPTAEGLRRALAAGVAAIVVTSRAQNPTGAIVTPARASALRRLLATARDVLVIEDDHAAELSLEPLAPLVGAGARWAFVRSVSKPYGPDLRLAVIAGDEATIARVEGRMRLGPGWVSTLLQRLVVELWRDPAVAEVVARARQTYARRRVALVDALATRSVPAHGRGGINIWVPVSDESVAVAALRDRGWAVGPGSLHRLGAGPGLRITTSRLTDGVERLADDLSDAVALSWSSAGGGGRR